MGRHPAVECQVPSKLILCGEHSVLYGTPALSLAINLPTQCMINYQPCVELEFCIELPDLALSQRYDQSQWQHEIRALQQRFDTFNAQPSARISEIITDPTQLILLCLDRIHRLRHLSAGQWQLRIHSSNWLGRGMGSSAAVILATLKALCKALQMHLDAEHLLQLATEIESFQHGRSSGLDPATLLAKTVIEFRIPNQIRPLGLKQLPQRAWLIDTGKPASSTGDCVTQVSRQFADDQALWKNFSQVIKQIKHAWQANDLSEFCTGIRQNQLLLEKIGVVPLPIQHFIRQLEQQQPNACAKVCGAGAVSGNSAGVVIYFGDTAPQTLCQAAGYKLAALELYSNDS